MNRPESRRNEIAKLRSRRYNWAVKADELAVERFERYCAARRVFGQTIFASDSDKKFVKFNGR
jgi:hypothetical protein